VIIVDGIPRCRSQVADLATRIDVRGVVYLECIDSQILEDRLQLRSVLEARADDKSAATLEARLRLFAEETLPLLDEYHANIVHRIDARQASTKVLSDVSDVVHRIQKSLKPDVLAVVTHPN
jgi:adenylate kinase family enzyme